MQVGYVFIVCVCVCLSVCLCVCLFRLETLFLVWWYILPICKSSLSINVIGLRSRSSHAKCSFCYLDIILTCFDLFEVKVINGVKVISRARLIRGQIVSVWLSISKQEVGLWLKGILKGIIVVGMCLSLLPTYAGRLCFCLTLDCNFCSILASKCPVRPQNLLWSFCSDMGW